MKKRVNLMIEDYDNDYLDETAEMMHMSKSELVSLAINLLTSTDENGVNIYNQLAACYDEKRPNAEFMPFSEKITRASVYANVKISVPN